MLRKILPVLALAAAAFVAVPAQANTIAFLSPTNQVPGTVAPGGEVTLSWALPANFGGTINAIRFLLDGRVLGDPAETGEFRYRLFQGPGGASAGNGNFRIFPNPGAWNSLNGNVPFNLDSGWLSDGATSGSSPIDFSIIISNGLLNTNVQVQNTSTLGVSFTLANVELDYNRIPEPGTVALMGFGLLAVGYAARRRRKA